jgi:hypothetical protein
MKGLLLLMQTRVQENRSTSVPDIISYSHVLAALSRAMNKDSAKTIVDIIDTIETEGKNGEGVAQLDSVGKFLVRLCSMLASMITSNKHLILKFPK